MLKIIVKIMIIAFGIQELVNVLYEYCYFNISIMDGLSKIPMFQIAIMACALIFVFSRKAYESNIGIYVGLTNCLAVYSVRAFIEGLVITNFVLNRVYIVLAVTMTITIVLRVLLGRSFDFYLCIILIYIFKFVSYFNLLGIDIYEYQVGFVSVFQAVLGLYLYRNKCKRTTERELQISRSGKIHN